MAAAVTEFCFIVLLLWEDLNLIGGILFLIANHQQRLRHG